jgi:hypothetical protein
MSIRDINAAIRQRLQERFCQPEWSIFFEVRSQTGGGAARSADAIAMSMWPSRGLAIAGFEVKAQRSDWQRERARPEKAEEIAAYCDEWWLVTAKGVAKEDEIPSAWGWLELTQSGEQLRTMKKPQQTEAKPLDRKFVASLLRSAGKVDENAVRIAVEEEVKRRRVNDEERVKREIERRSADAERLREKYKVVSSLCEKHGYTPTEELVAAVNAVLQARVTGTFEGLTQLENKLVGMANQVAKAREFWGIPSEERTEKIRAGQRKNDLGDIY